MILVGIELLMKFVRLLTKTKEIEMPKNDEVDALYRDLLVKFGGLRDGQLAKLDHEQSPLDEMRTHNLALAYEAAYRELKRLRGEFFNFVLGAA